MRKKRTFMKKKLDEGKILLFVKDLERVGEWLQEMHVFYLNLYPLNL